MDLMIHFDCRVFRDSKYFWGTNISNILFYTKRWRIFVKYNCSINIQNKSKFHSDALISKTSQNPACTSQNNLKSPKKGPSFKITTGADRALLTSRQKTPSHPTNKSEFRCDAQQQLRFHIWQGNSSNTPCDGRNIKHSFNTEWSKIQKLREFCTAAKGETGDKTLTEGPLQLHGTAPTWPSKNYK